MKKRVCPRCKLEYAIYKGEDCLAIGTVNEIAKQQKVKIETIKFMLSPTYARRLAKRNSKNAKIIVCIDDED